MIDLAPQRPTYAKFKPKSLASFLTVDPKDVFQEKKLNFLKRDHVVALLRKSKPMRIMKVATVFEFIISAMDTRVRSMRRMEKKSSVITDPLAVWDFTTANRFQLSFLHDAQDSLRSTLELIDIKFHVELAKKSIILIRDKMVLRVSDLRSALADIDAMTEEYVRFDYHHIIETMIEGSSKVLNRHCSKLERGRRPGSLRAFTANIKPRATKVDGKITQFRRHTTFRITEENKATADHNTPPTCSILYTDVLDLSDEDAQTFCINLRCDSKGQAMRRLVYKYAFLTCREVLKGVQLYAGQRDVERFQWCREHHASYPAGSLFLAVCEELKKILPTAFTFEVFSTELRESIFKWAGWDIEIKNDFFAWRDSYGKTSPSMLRVSANSKVSQEFKEVLCVDSCYVSQWALQQQLDFIFSVRPAQNVRRFVNSEIALQVRHRVGSRILRLNAPTSSNSTQRDVPCCDARPPIVAMCMQSKGPSEVS